MITWTWLCPENSTVNAGAIRREIITCSLLAGVRPMFWTDWGTYRNIYLVFLGGGPNNPVLSSNLGNRLFGRTNTLVKLARQHPFSVQARIRLAMRQSSLRLIQTQFRRLPAALLQKTRRPPCHEKKKQEEGRGVGSKLLRQATP